MIEFTESVENDYAKITAYYESEGDMYVLFVEKSHQTPEEKKKQQELLKKLKYDPKTKTIEVDGHRTSFRIDRENPESAHATVAYIRNKEYSRQSKLLDKNRAELHKVGKSMTKEEERKNRATNDRINASNKSAYQRSKRGYFSNGSGKHIHGITVGGKNLDEGTVLHEVGHVRDFSNRRRAEAEPSYVSKYGTKELSKDTRKARLELNKLKKKPEKDLTSSEKRRVKKLEDQVQKGIENTPSYQNDNGQKNRDAINKADKEIVKQINKKRRKLNKHDKMGNEYYADEYAKKHHSAGKGIDFKDLSGTYKKTNKFMNTKEGKRQFKENEIEQLKELKKKGVPISDSAIEKAKESKIMSAASFVDRKLVQHQNKKHIKSTKNREKIGKKISKKNYAAIESVEDMDDMISDVMRGIN